MNKKLLSDGFECYLEIDGTQGEDYEYQMLLVNHIDSILPVNIMTVNETRKLIYSASGYRTLENSLEKMPIEGKQMMKVLEAVLDGVDEIKRYLLSPNNLVLSPDCFFVELDYSRVGLVYVPGYHQDIIDQLRQLIECLTEKINASDMGGVLFAWHLHILMKEEHISLREIRKILNRYKEGSTLPPSVMKQVEEQPEYKEIDRRERKQRWELKGNLPLLLCGICLVLLVVGGISLLVSIYAGGITPWKRNLLLLFVFFFFICGSIWITLWKKEKVIHILKDLQQKVGPRGKIS